MQHRLSIEYGDEILFSTGLSEEEFSAEARFLLAAKLYELGRLSSGQAAKLCGKNRMDFLLSLPRVGVPVSNLRPEDAKAEIEFMRRGGVHYHQYRPAYHSGAYRCLDIVSDCPMSFSVPNGFAMNSMKERGWVTQGWLPHGCGYVLSPRPSRLLP